MSAACYDNYLGTPPYTHTSSSPLHTKNGKKIILLTVIVNFLLVGRDTIIKVTNKRKCLAEALFTVSEGESMTVVARRMAAGK